MISLWLVHGGLAEDPGWSELISLMCSHYKYLLRACGVLITRTEP